jgi:hypothetical protein
MLFLRSNSAFFTALLLAAVVAIVTVPPEPVVEPEAIVMVAAVMEQVGESVAPVGEVASVQPLSVMVPA